MTRKATFLSTSSTPGNGTKISKALEDLTQKRHQQIGYLRRVHLSDLDNKTQHPQTRSYWLNTIQLSVLDINSTVNSHRKIRGYFCLGTSIGKLVDQDGSPALINALIQLIEEYTFEFGSKIGSKFTYLRAKNISDKSEQNNKNSDPIKPYIWKQHNKVVFEFLDTPKIPEGIDYCLVVHALLSTLYVIYSKFLDPSCSNEKWRQAIEEIDEKISTMVLKPITDVLTKLTFKCVSNEIQSLLPQNIQSLSTDFKSLNNGINNNNNNNINSNNNNNNNDPFDLPMVDGNDFEEEEDEEDEVNFNNKNIKT